VRAAYRKSPCHRMRAAVTPSSLTVIRRFSATSRHRVHAEVVLGEHAGEDDPRAEVPTRLTIWPTRLHRNPCPTSRASVSSSCSTVANSALGVRIRPGELLSGRPACARHHSHFHRVRRRPPQRGIPTGTYADRHEGPVKRCVQAFLRLVSASWRRAAPTTGGVRSRPPRDDRRATPSIRSREHDAVDPPHRLAQRSAACVVVDAEALPAAAPRSRPVGVAVHGIGRRVDTTHAV